MADTPNAVAEPADKPTHEEMMAGYAVACRFKVYEAQAFELAEQMWHAFRTAGVPGRLTEDPKYKDPSPFLDDGKAWEQAARDVLANPRPIEEIKQDIANGGLETFRTK